MQITTQFADFLLEVIENDLKSNNVVKISSSPSIYIYLGTKSTRTGRNPETGEKLVIEGGNSLRWIIPSYDDSLTEGELLESLKRNNIQLIIKEFSFMQALLDEVKKNCELDKPTLITTENGQQILEIFFDPNEFFFIGESYSHRLLQKLPLPALAYEKIADPKEDNGFHYLGLMMKKEV